MHDQVDKKPGRILVEVLVLVGGCHVDGVGVSLVDVFTEVSGFREGCVNPAACGVGEEWKKGKVNGKQVDISMGELLIGMSGL